MYLQEPRNSTITQDIQLAIREVNTGHNAKGEAVLPNWERRGSVKNHHHNFRKRTSYTLHTGWSCSKAVHKPVWHIPLLSVQRKNSWWCTEELSETCRFSCQNKFVNLVHLFRFVIKKFVTMHGHTNVKYSNMCLLNTSLLQAVHLFQKSV
jgi:hypothetical protein